MSSTNLQGAIGQLFANRTLASWDDVAKLLAFTSQFNGHSWLFRGARNEAYSLTPKVGRDERKKKGTQRIPYLLEDELAVLNAFRLRARAHIQYSPQTALEWLALAQHHGAPTRLLDWTEGLLVALWFAGEGCTEYVESEGRLQEVSRDGRLWCAWDVPSASADGLDDPFSVTHVGTYRPAHFDRRISAQQSVFTLQPDPRQPFEFSNLATFSLKHRFKFELRKRLDAAGINRRALFPDLAGLGEDLAWRYKNNWLAAYRPHSTRR